MKELGIIFSDQLLSNSFYWMLTWVRAEMLTDDEVRSLEGDDKYHQVRQLLDEGFHDRGFWISKYANGLSMFNVY